MPEGARLFYGDDGLLPLVVFENIYLFPGVPRLFAAKLPSLKTDVGDWSVTPHSARIIAIDRTSLCAFRDLVGDDCSPEQARVLLPVGRHELEALPAIAANPRFGGLPYAFDSGFQSNLAVADRPGLGFPSAATRSKSAPRQPAKRPRCSCHPAR